MEKKDIRLYYYEHGTLKKWGRLRTPNVKMRHFFDDVEECVDHVYKEILTANDVWEGTRKKTFVVVEYFDSYKSEIVCLVNKLNCIYLH